MTGTFLNQGLVAAFALFAAAPPDPPNDSALIQRVFRLYEDSEKLVPSLARIASRPDRPQSDRQDAIAALGKIKSRTAIIALLENLLVTADTITEFHETSLYPAATCLREIGSPGYPQIWDKLGHKCSDEYLHVLGLVITRFDGKEIAIIRVKQRQSHPGISQEQKSNLQKLLALIETVDFDDFKNWRSGAPNQGK